MKCKCGNDAFVISAEHKIVIDENFDTTEVEGMSRIDEGDIHCTECNALIKSIEDLKE